MGRQGSRWIWWVLVAILAPGCTPRGTAEPVPPVSASEGRPTQPSATSTPARPAAGVVITLTRTGGIAGISEHWSIYEDGRIREAAGREGQVPREEVAQLLADIETLGFFEWAPLPRSLPGCADCISYALTVEHSGKANRITLVDGETGAPEQAWEILRRVLAMLAAGTS